MDYYKLKVLNNRKMIIIIICFLIAVSSLIYYFFIYEDNNYELKKEDDIEVDREVVSNERSIYVDIKGQVINPGVYEFKEGDNARVNDLIEKAGGLTDDADTSLINLSKKLSDEMTIIIYSLSEINEYVSIKEELEKKLNLCEITLKNNACIKENNMTDSDLININKASKEEIMRLSGIGEVKANAIVEYRKNHPFEKIEDIMNVDGIGESLFESIKDHLTI